ncbi:MAG: VOC family protein [Deltaproteobacteria bacterium]|nr:VOC family protein [Deltaproteobacteria bacterium]
MTQMLFVNLPVSDLERSKRFFTTLGFEIDPRWTDEKAACVVLNPDTTYVMLLDRAFFETFTERAICGSQATEALLALSAESRDAVDAMVEKALAHGGAAAMPPQDHGFMYGHSFYDPDGHHWEVLWMDVEAAMKANANG